MEQKSAYDKRQGAQDLRRSFPHDEKRTEIVDAPRDSTKNPQEGQRAGKDTQAARIGWRYRRTLAEAESPRFVWMLSRVAGSIKMANAPVD
jgi:hypothetical protein